MIPSTAHRLNGWQLRFIDLVNAEVKKPFNWVHASCGNLMATGVNACYTDHPILENLTGYTTESEAKAQLTQLGGLVAILERHFEVIPNSLATDADIGVITDDTGTINAGVIIVDGIALGKREHETRPVFRLPIMQVTKVFRV